MPTHAALVFSRLALVICSGNLGHTSAGTAPHADPVLEEPVTTSDLLNAWREATRAADLAERLATLAAETARRATVSADTAEEIAAMAERAAESAAAAADRARAAAREARQAAENDQGATVEAERIQAGTRDFEAAARDAYHDAEADAQSRHRNTAD